MNKLSNSVVVLMGESVTKLDSVRHDLQDLVEEPHDPLNDTMNELTEAFKGFLLVETQLQRLIENQCEESDE